ncbi:helix-turn-helix domain-containing protein [Salmonella enterica subsp. enterica serovar Newport]|nr:helix-turn-helix domain-containing protein [Salmonella enterica subsp. enterica serovar Newport]
METFFGLPLNKTDSLGNIADMLKIGMLLNCSTSNELVEAADIVFNITRDYCLATDKFIKKSTTTPQLTPLQPGDTLTIGARIQHARENLGMSKAALANKLDLTPECIADWEDGNCPLEASYVIPLANALKCDPMWLLTGNPVDVKPATPAPVNVMKGADLANIGVRIESRRNYIEMSLNKLAETIDTSGAMIREWETGKAIPHSDYIDKLAKALNTTVTWLMTGKHITA